MEGGGGATGTCWLPILPTLISVQAASHTQRRFAVCPRSALRVCESVRSGEGSRVPDLALYWNLQYYGTIGLPNHRKLFIEHAQSQQGMK